MMCSGLTLADSCWLLNWRKCGFLEGEAIEGEYLVLKDKCLVAV